MGTERHLDWLPKLIQQYWAGNESLWLEKLAARGGVGIDWPRSLGGPGWSRQQQLRFIDTLSEHGCPLYPAAITDIAPLLISLGSPAQQQALLPSIKEKPGDWRFVIGDEDEPGQICRLDEGDAPGLYICGETLGLPGHGHRHLALCASPLLMLHELKTSLHHIKTMAVHWQDAPDTGTSELEIRTRSLEGLYLRHNESADRQIVLLAHQLRLPCFSRLFASLGYQALLDPEPNLTGNEPLPFAAERRHLANLLAQTDRDEMFLQDQLYSEYLAQNP